MNSDKFNQIKDTYGKHASWAVWAEVGDTPKSNIDDLGVFESDSVLHLLKPNVVLVGLNISREIERPLGNFHDGNKAGQDFKLRHALKSSPYWGGYMTDVIKSYTEPVSGKLMLYLRQNPEYEKKNIRTFCKELDDIGATDPILIALGGDTYKILKQHLGDEFTIMKVPHYASYIGKEKYREKFQEVLGY